MENTINADPLIYEDMDFIREVFARHVARIGCVDWVFPLIDTVVSVLETDALLARTTGKRHIFNGKLSVADAVQRARDLRDLTRR